jgi:predicted acyltransferase
MTSNSLQTDPQQRLNSLDALRGFDMFWITGGGALAIAISQITGAGWLENQMNHVEWEGFRFFDLIFPLLCLVLV